MTPFRDQRGWYRYGGAAWQCSGVSYVPMDVDASLFSPGRPALPSPGLPILTNVSSAEHNVLVFLLVNFHAFHSLLTSGLEFPEVLLPCMCVRLCVLVCVPVCAPVWYVYLCVYVPVCACVHTRVCTMCVYCVCTCVCTCVYLCMHLCVPVYLCVHLCVCTCVCTHMHLCSGEHLLCYYSSSSIETSTSIRVNVLIFLKRMALPFYYTAVNSLVAFLLLG